MNTPDIIAAFARAGLDLNASLTQIAHTLVGLAGERDYWRIQAQDVLVDLHAAERELAALRELRDDVERWRESGDARDLLYVIETLDELITDESGCARLPEGGTRHDDR